MISQKNPTIESIILRNPDKDSRLKGYSIPEVSLYFIIPIPYFRFFKFVKSLLPCW